MNFGNTIDNFTERWVVSNRPNGNSHESESSMSRSGRNDSSPTLQPSRFSTDSPPLLSSPATMQPDNITSALGIRSIPVHCVVRRSDSEIGAVVLSESTTVLQDTFAILPGNMLFKDIIRGALAKLEFPSSEAIGAKGFIQMRNWKPLMLSSVADSPTCTIEEILGDITATGTLIICLSRVSLDDVVWTDEAVRSAVYMLLKEVSQTALAKLSPLPQSMISNIINSKYTAMISSGTCAEFGQWYRQYRADHEEPHITMSIRPHCRQTFHSKYELPLMRSWYQESFAPSDEQFNAYLAELNASPMRQERGAISLSRLRMWWKNEKQRCDRRLNVTKEPPRARRSSAPLRTSSGETPDEDQVRSEELEREEETGKVETAAGETVVAPKRRRRRRKMVKDLSSFWPDGPDKVQEPLTKKFSTSFPGFESGGVGGNNVPAVPNMYERRVHEGNGSFARNESFNNVHNNDDNNAAARHRTTTGGGAPTYVKTNPQFAAQMRCLSVSIDTGRQMPPMEFSRAPIFGGHQSPFDMLSSPSAGGHYSRLSSSVGPGEVSHHQAVPLSLIRSNWN